MDNIKQYEKINRKAECITYQLPCNDKKVMNKVLNIDLELRDLLPPLSQEEYQLLEQNIKTNGCLDPIITWTDPNTGITYIIDGHNRYEICTKHSIKFQTIELGFKTKDDVIQWMVETQLGRRNLSALQRVEISEKYRPIYEKKAKENLKTSTGGNNPQPLPKSANPVNTRDALSKIAKVGHDTYNKAKKIVDLEKDASDGKVQLTEEQKQVIEKAKKDEIKVNTAFNELFGKPKIENKPKLEQKEEIKPTENKKDGKVILQNEDKIKEIIKDIKTPKFVEIKIDLNNELDCFYDNVSDFIETINDILFERYNIEEIISFQQKEKAIKYTKKIIDSLQLLNSKINLINIKGE